MSRHEAGRLAALVVIGGALVISAAAALYVVSRPERVPPNTYVAGVAVGGLQRRELTTALIARVQPRVELPLSVTAGVDQFELTARELGIRLDIAATSRAALSGRAWWQDLPFASRPRRNVAARFVVDTAAAESSLDSKLDQVRHGPVDATIDLPRPAVTLDAKGDASFTARSVRAVIHPGRPGQSVDMATAAAAIRTAVAHGQRMVTLDVKMSPARVPTAALKGIDQLIGTFTTYHACCEPRVTNIHRIAEIVDGAVVAPGATFSLNAAAGRRTAANGFVAAPAIADGELVQQLGGGVSQFSTTLFNATWFAGLTSLKHQPHSKYISRYPPGREATLDYDSIDQVFRNDTNAPVIIRTLTTDTSVTVALYGHTGRRTVTSTTGPQLPRNGGGFSVSVTRQVSQDGRPRTTDTIRWTYTGFD